jgi:hypothetical protein
MKAFVLLIFVFSILGCSSKKKKSELVDIKPLEKKNQVSGEGSLGVRDNAVVYQRKVYLAEELRQLENDAYNLETKVYGHRDYGGRGLYGVYKDCNAKLSNPKVGGDGTLSPIEPAARVLEDEKESKYGVDDKDQLVGVSEEFLSDRVNRFKKFRKILRKREDEYSEKIRICEARFKAGLAKHGLTEKDI